MIPGAVPDTFHEMFRSRRRNNRGALAGVAISAVAALVLASPRFGRTEEKPINIGVLALGPRNVPIWHCGQEDYQLASAEPRRETMPFYIVGLRDELETLKYVEARPDNAARTGRRFALDVRMGSLEELRGFAREFVRERVDMIVGVASAAVQVAQEATRDHPIPTLMTAVSEPVQEGFVQSVARPGGFITGVSHQLVQGSGKRVELFKEIVPGLRRMITMRRPNYGPSEKSIVDTREAARQLNVEVVEWSVNSRGELKTLLQNAHWEPGDGMMILPDSLLISNTDLILETSLRQRVPTFGLQDYMADWGALAAYGPSAYEAGRHAARYVDKIAKGASPGELPVEPIDPTFVVNLKAAACLGISVPLEILHEADRIVR